MKKEVKFLTSIFLAGQIEKEMSFQNGDNWYFGIFCFEEWSLEGLPWPRVCIWEVLLNYNHDFNWREAMTHIFSTKAPKAHFFNIYFTHLIFFWIFCHCFQMSGKELQSFIMMFGQVVNLKHIIFMMDLEAEFQLHLQKYKIIPTSLFNVFRRSRGSSLRLASIKSAYLSDNNNKKNKTSLSQIA